MAEARVLTLTEMDTSANVLKDMKDAIVKEVNSKKTNYDL
jgi:hypothetical protein